MVLAGKRQAQLRFRGVVPDLKLTAGAWFRVRGSLRAPKGWLLMGNRFWARVQKQPGFWKQLQEAVESAQLIASAKGWFRWWNSLQAVVHCERYQPQKKARHQRQKGRQAT
ncbi:hypothetical protein HMPREF2605_00005 [Rothia sp. HMSC065C03]|nr:hypothetical protein HMPREF2605_00005 [Rothia sp. HMSC065C03]